MKPRRSVNVDSLLCLITVDCAQEQHRIGLTTNGALVFYDHLDDNLKIEDDLRRIGDLEAACTCAQVYRNWIDDRRWKLPSPLDDWREKMRTQRFRKRYRRPVRLADPLVATTARKRAEIRVVREAAKVFPQATYRQGDKHKNEIAIVPRNEAEIATEKDCYTKNKIRYIDTTFYLRLPLRWLVHVHQRGLSLLEVGEKKYFVIDALGSRRRDGSQLLRVVKQSRGYGLKVVNALLTKRGAVRWL